MRVTAEVEAKAGPLDEAVQCANSFWSWWHDNLDSDQQLAVSSHEAVESAVLGALPEALRSEENARKIARGTMVISFDHFESGTPNQDVFNRLMLEISALPSWTPALNDEMFRHPDLSYMDEEYVVDLINFVKLLKDSERS